MKRMLLASLLLGTSLVVADLAVADSTQLFHYGALAVDRRDGFSYGWANDHPSMASAGDRAVEECRKRGGQCRVVLVWFGRGCGAYRTVEGKVGDAYGWGAAPTREEADTIARAEAVKRSNGRPVGNHVFGCNADNAADFRAIYDAGLGIDPKVITHNEFVATVAVSADGRIIASRGGPTIRLWDAATGTLIRSFGGQEPIFDIAFSPDGARLASIDRYHAITIWDVASGLALRKMQGNTSRGNAIAWSPDGALVASAATNGSDAAEDRGVRLWNPNDGSLVDKATAPFPNDIRSLAFAPDGTLFTGGVGLGSSSIKVRRGAWASADEREPIAQLSVSPDGRFLAASLWQEDVVRVYEASSGRLLRELRSKEERNVVFGVAFSPDSRELASGHTNGSIHIWDPESGERVQTLTGHTAAVGALAYAPTGGALVSGSSDHTIRIWPRPVGGSDRRYRALLNEERDKIQATVKARSMSTASQARKRLRK